MQSHPTSRPYLGTTHSDTASVRDMPFFGLNAATGHIYVETPLNDMTDWTDMTVVGRA